MNKNCHFLKYIGFFLGGGVQGVTNNMSGYFYVNERSYSITIDKTNHKLVLGCVEVVGKLFEFVLEGNEGNFHAKRSIKKRN